MKRITSKPRRTLDPCFTQRFNDQTKNPFDNYTTTAATAEGGRKCQ